MFLNLNINFLYFILFNTLLYQIHCSIDTQNLIEIEEDKDWNLNLDKFKFLQLAGIAYNKIKDELSLFHRSNILWDANSFDFYNIYLLQNKLINEDVILNFDLKSKKLVSSWGKNLFYLPHGISFDSDGNIWLTDVALHQVFKFNSTNYEKSDKIFGEKFQPGSDFNHFCKPTDVQISENKKLIFISDGYCNKRVVVYDSNYNFIKNLGQHLNMQVPHSLALIEDLNLLCIADREQHRLIFLDSGNKNITNLGRFKFKIDFDQFAPYAVEYLGNNFVFCVLKSTEESKGSLIKLKENSYEIKLNYNLPLIMPHDLTSDSQNNIYISEIDKDEKIKLRKFRIKNLFDSQLNSLAKNFILNKNKRVDFSNELKQVEKEFFTTPLNKNDKNSLTKNDNKEEKIKNEEKSLKEEKNVMSNKDENKKDEKIENKDLELKAKKKSLLFFLTILFIFILITATIYSFKKKIGLNSYIKNLGLIQVIYSKDTYRNDPEKAGFNRLNEEEENLFDFTIDNDSSESEVEEFNFRQMKKV